MAYDPTIPALNNYIGDDIPKIMTNFAELAGSRIIDHNLDVPNPPNGYYIRWANGFQLCFHWLAVPQGSPAEGTWTFPAAFTSTFGFWGSTTSPTSGLWLACSVLWGHGVGATTLAAWYLIQDGGTSSSTAGFGNIFLLALGRWK